MHRTLLLTALVLLVAGCAGLRVPGVYRVTIQQGNVITQDMVDRLKPGMTPRQVRFILGEPILANSFRPDRWDYVYTIQVGNNARQQQRLTLWFEEEALVGFEGDFAPSAVLDSEDAEGPARPALPGIAASPGTG
ncbi:MAG: outer membrane protein assembly factor BamE [Pseudomonadales bacterium]|jgi:outer membrane protein assembly factor BamE|nr:outer membrane protein assembly factor BamE [Pseudomonadales bacterium]